MSDYDYWVKMAQDPIDNACLPDDKLLELAIDCARHAYEVNRPFFSRKIPEQRLQSVEALIADFERLASGAVRPEEREWNDSLKIMPKADSEEEIVAGWVALLDAFGELETYALYKYFVDLYGSMYMSFVSVAGRATAEHVGTEYNTGIGSGQELQFLMSDKTCAAEIAYQLAQMQRLAAEAGNRRVSVPRLIKNITDMKWRKLQSMFNLCPSFTLLPENIAREAGPVSCYQDDVMLHVARDLLAIYVGQAANEGARLDFAGIFAALDQLTFPGWPVDSEVTKKKFIGLVKRIVRAGATPDYLRQFLSPKLDRIWQETA